MAAREMPDPAAMLPPTASEDAARAMQRSHDALREHAALVAALCNPAAWPHPVDTVQVLETHISTVLLAGPHACKLKKPVSLGFADFSTPALRRHCCNEELRINRRTAPALYLGLCEVAGPRERPRMLPVGVAAGSSGIEVALCMRRFDQDALLDHLARAGRLEAGHMDRLAAGLLRFHAQAAAAPADTPFGSAALVQRWTQASLVALRRHLHDGAERARLHAVDAALQAEFERRAAAIGLRRLHGRVRECHGDLHLGNLVLVDGEPLPFDAIEFNDELRWIDVVSDVAFVFMDLLAHGLPRLAWRLLGRWLQGCGDDGGLALLRYYAAYRALVRAQVAAIREQQQGGNGTHHASLAGHLQLAQRLLEPAAPVVVAMSGLSGSGKSVVAQSLAEQLGGVCVRSDVERKRLFGLPATARVPAAEIYGAAAGTRTYERLHQVVRSCIDARVPVVVDAASLRRHERHAMRELAESLDVRFHLVVCDAPLPLLRRRVAERAAQGTDPSDADAAVLEQQLQWREPIAADEQPVTVVLETDTGLDRLDAACGDLAARMGAGMTAA
jgi:aminoglycoside phosphotransferase family enzyme/predicted kinase